MVSTSGVSVGGSGTRVAVAAGEGEETTAAVEVADVVGDGGVTTLIVVAVGQGVGDGGGVGGVHDTRLDIKPTKINNRRGEQLAMALVRSRREGESK